MESQDLAAHPRVRIALPIAILVAALAASAGYHLNVLHWHPITSTAQSPPPLQLDPNTAPWPDLAAIPRLGASHAKSIVEFRQSHPPHPFNTLSDLRQIPGIGPKTLQAIAPYLTLPTTPDTPSDP